MKRRHFLRLAGGGVIAPAVALPLAGCGWSSDYPEAAVQAWRNTMEHRRTQAKGRAQIFADYHLRIASVIRDYGMNDREQAPKDSRAVHDAH